MNRVCISCGATATETTSHGWWSYQNYSGPQGQTLNGKTLNGFTCPACSNRVYEEPGFYEKLVAAQEAKAAIG